MAVLLSSQCLPQQVCQLGPWEGQAFLCVCSRQAFNAMCPHVSTGSWFPMGVLASRICIYPLLCQEQCQKPQSLIGPCCVMFGVIRTHETTASSPSCLQYASTTQHVPLQQALLVLFPGMDACKMNIVWKQCIILPRPPNICLLLIALVHSLSMSKQNEWPGFRSLCIPPPLFPTRIMLCSIT